MQWSEEGIASSFKFIQKLWNLNKKILDEIKKNHERDSDLELEKYTNKFLKKVTDNLENFSYNKIVANLHEVYSFLIKQINVNYTKNTLIKNYEKILITMMPVIPHFSSECLSLINSNTTKWPDYDKNKIQEEIINIVVQINGKKRGLIKTTPDISENDLFNIINKDEKLIKYLDKKIIKKKIFIKDKLINIII